MSEPLRIGLLGAARITPDAVVGPAHELGHRLVAVAARDEERARDFAAEHGVERVVADYDALLADPEVDLVYNPLANGLHGRWNVAALRAGKDVLTEKPSAADAAEARAVHDVARETGRALLEGFHHAHHPLWLRVHEILAAGELGGLVSVEAVMHMPAPDDDDPRWSAELAGGSVMDVGCYALHAVRDLAAHVEGGHAIPVVLSARGEERFPGVDGWLDADLDLGGGVSGRIRSSMVAPDVDFRLEVVGERGSLSAPCFIKPQLDDRLLVRVDGAERVEHLGARTSYTYQLAAVAAHLNDGVPFRTDAADAVVAMELVDACYTAAGMAPRRPTT
ncbi:Gfo/Idh/MocA family protein [Kineococcus gynurae]|uniref:Gfo/Idh/MocA family protein n=1 Tax=Kineococcus gynurae TaxID=452979 RepID=A0ABV5LNS3_9ACTN